MDCPASQHSDPTVSSHHRRLMRDLDAATVIDLATWRAGGEPPEFQRREQVAIRGRSQREDLYVLPQRGKAAR